MESVRLGEICGMAMGCEPSPIKTHLTDNRGTPWIKIGDIIDNKISGCKEWILPESERFTKIAKRGDLLLSYVGSVPGVVCLVELERCAYGIQFVSLEPNKQKVFKKYLFYWLIRNQKQLLKYANGSVQKRLCLGILKKVRIDLPSLEMQAKTVEIIEPFYNLWINEKKELTCLKEIYQKILDKIFDVKNSDVMESVRLGEICGMAKGREPSPIKPHLTDNQGTPWIKIGDIIDNKISGCKEWILPESERFTKIAKRGDLLLSYVGVPGIVCLVELERCAYGSQLVSLEPNKQKVFKKYLFYWLIRNQKQLLKYANGSVQKRLCLGSLKKVRIDLPSLEMQTKMVEIIEPFYNLIINKTKEINFSQKTYLNVLNHVIK